MVVANEGDDIVAHFTYEEGALVTAVSGSHAGRIGTVDEIQVTPGSSANNVLIDAVDGDERFETVEEYVVVIDENFTDEDTDAADEESQADDESPDEDADADEADADEADEDESADADDGGDDE